jgi:hypothetical protein
MSYILNGLLEAKQVRKKRKHIQRRLIFDEPVLGISLETLSQKDNVKRTDAQTDETKKIENLEAVKSFEAEKLSEAGYLRTSDINNRSTRLLNREVDLPWNALNELKNIVDSNADSIVPFAIDETVIERKEQEQAVSNLLQSDTWCCMLMYEIGMLRWCERELKEEASGDETKKNLVNILIDGSYRPDRYTREISDFVGVSEQYVKDVISGRVEYGLSSSERDEILDRDDNMCRNCGETKELEVHHIIPVNQGGTKDDDNLCTLCEACHKDMAHGQTMADVSYDTKDEFWDIVDGDD